MTTRAPLLTLRNVGFSFSNVTDNGETTLLQNINLKVYEGEFIAVVGTSGSGKTTLLNILGLLSQPTAGQYFINGENVTCLNQSRLAALRNTFFGYIFQNFYLLSGLSVFENVLLPARYSTLVNWTHFSSQAKQLLSTLGLSSLHSRNPTLLSGGHKQRLAIARALLLNPKVILADEPTGALDSDNAQNVMTLLKEIHLKDKTTIILVTHDHHLASQAQRIIKIEDGQIFSDSGPQYHENTSEYPIHNSMDADGNPFNICLSNLFQNVKFGLMDLATLFRIYKQSSLYNILTIALGISTLLMVSASFHTISHLFLEFTKSDTTNSVRIWSEPPLERNTAPWTGFHLLHSNGLPHFQKAFESKSKIYPKVNLYGCVFSSPWEKGEFTIQGITDFDSYMRKNIKLAQGDGLSLAAFDWHHRLKGVVIGPQVAQKLFTQALRGPLTTQDFEHVIGKYIRILEQPPPFNRCPLSGVFQIQGVMKQRNTLYGGDFNNAILMPLPLIYQSGLNPWQYQFEMIPNGGNSEQLPAEIKGYLQAQTGNRYAFTTHKDTFGTKILNLVNLIGMIGTGFGLLCVVMAGSGIMNVQLSSLSTRIREFGIQRAVGATSQRIAAQLIMESAFLFLLGGFIGVTFGLVLFYIAREVGAFYFPSWFESIGSPPFPLSSIFLSLITTALTGILFGLYPAWCASQISINKALKRI